MIYVVSNRNINDTATDHTLFGDDLNQEGQDCIRIAQAEKNGDDWRLSLMDEQDGAPLPSEVIFDNLTRDASNDGKPWVFFVHGFNQSLKKNLDKAREIEGYGVNVVAFSWPSNPGPQWIILKRREYRRAQDNAQRSVYALNRTLLKFHDYIRDAGVKESPNLVVHSLGNFLLESLVRHPFQDHQLEQFQNIVLHQADVDSSGHAEWVEPLANHSRVYVTVNETDDVLDASDVINPNRLGNTPRDFDAQGVHYFDFSDTKHSDDDHRLWRYTAEKNDAVQMFFKNVFHGKRGERTPSATYDFRTNGWRIP